MTAITVKRVQNAQVTGPLLKLSVLRYPMVVALAPQHGQGRTARMWIEEIAPERLAEFLHHYHQALEVFGKGSESGSWKEMAKPEKNRLVAAARLTLLAFDSTKNQSSKSRPYFAKPGEAEWGC